MPFQQITWRGVGLIHRVPVAYQVSRGRDELVPTGDVSA